MTFSRPHSTRRPGRILACLICKALILRISTATGIAQDLAEHEKWLQGAEAAYCGVTNYTAIFHKQQRVDGKLLREETILMKFKRPASLHLRWIAAPFKGCEVLYVEGWNGNRARVHRGGLLRFVTWNIPPTHPRLMEGNLRPLTDTGLGYLVTAVAANIRKAGQAGELAFFERGEETVYGRRTLAVEAVFPKDKAKGYDAYRMVINQDRESKLLVRIRAYDWDDLLFENYGYENIDLEVRLTDADFDPKNPACRF